MKKFSTIFSLICIVSALVFAQEWQYQTNPKEYEEMTLETYEIALANAQRRENGLKAEIAQEEAEIARLRGLLAETDQKIVDTKAEWYTILGITEDDVAAAEAEIAAIRDELNLLLGLTPDELLKRAEDIEKVAARIAALKDKPVSYLWRIRDQIVELEQLLQQVRANLPDKVTSYTVKLNPGKRDCLYRIASFEEIYQDPSQWPKIYQANKTLIDSDYQKYQKYTEDSKYSRPEDLIFPGQVLDIPR